MLWAMFQLFENLRDEGKSILMVTHDDEHAQRADDVFLLDNGVLVNEYLSSVLDELNDEQFTTFIKHAHVSEYGAGTTIVTEGTVGDEFYIVLDGQVDVYVKRSTREVLVGRKTKGEYFGEMALLGDGRRSATVRTGTDTGVKLASINLSAFQSLMETAPAFREQMQQLFKQHQSIALLPTEEIEIPTL